MLMFTFCIIIFLKTFNKVSWRRRIFICRTNVMVDILADKVQIDLNSFTRYHLPVQQAQWCKEHCFLIKLFNTGCNCVLSNRIRYKRNPVLASVSFNVIANIKMLAIKPFRELISRKHTCSGNGTISPHMTAVQPHRC